MSKNSYIMENYIFKEIFYMNQRTSAQGSTLAHCFLLWDYSPLGGKPSTLFAPVGLVEHISSSESASMDAIATDKWNPATPHC